MTRSCRFAHLPNPVLPGSPSDRLGGHVQRHAGRSTTARAHPRSTACACTRGEHEVPLEKLAAAVGHAGAHLSFGRDKRVLAVATTAEGPAIAPLIAAVAASMAAAFSLVTLWVSGRREQRKWRRDTLVEALVDFVSGSFAGGGQRVLQARLDGESLEPHRVKTKEAHSRQTEALTRLRLLAPWAVIVAAERLHEADHAVQDRVLGESEVPADAEWTHLRHEQALARTELLNAARRALGERDGPPVGHHHPPA